MGEVVICVEKLGKQYRIGELQSQYKTLRKSIVDTLDVPFRWLKSLKSGTSNQKVEIIWALKDISFTVRRGEVVGIIGRNGAGKSTLLKILSRITEPTTGRIEICGRLASLLEVGTGFHLELTGRENIYLNGAILGMKRTEIERRFNEIVAFAEIEKFLDTPVKHYSSGMYMRLAFAVAAHLEPEILLVDEVLAVGDTAFQKKCLGKMESVAKEGRTVLFVSHNMGAVNQLCEQVLWLDNGQMVKMGPSQEIIHDYLYNSISMIGKWTNFDAIGTDLDIDLLSACITRQGGISTSVVRFDEDFKVEIYYEIYSFVRSPWTLIFRVSNSVGIAVFTSWDIDSAIQDKPKHIGKYRASCLVPGKFLKPGTYSVSLGIYFTNTNMKMSNFYEHCFYFEISAVGYSMNLNRGGIITPILNWSIEKNDE